MVVKPETIHRVHNILVVHFGVGYKIAHAINHAIASPYAIVKQLDDWTSNNQFDGWICDYELSITKKPNPGLIQTQMTAFCDPDVETRMRIHFQTPTCCVDFDWKNARNTYTLRYGAEVHRAWRTVDYLLSTNGVFEWLEFIMKRFTNA